MTKHINCLIVDDEPVAREIIENHLQKIGHMHVLASCKNAIEAFKEISAHQVDLIFLDINMPEISGLLFAKSINKNIKVIFTTAYREYAIDGFDLQAVDYLLKPISFDRLLQAVNKYLGENTPSVSDLSAEVIEDKSDFIFIRSDRKMIKLNFSDVNYVESFSDYIKIHLDDKTIVTRETISNIEAKLPQKDFLRIHRSYIVSFAKIESFTNECIEVKNKTLPISRSYKSDVIARLSKP